MSCQIVDELHVLRLATLYQEFHQSMIQVSLRVILLTLLCMVLCVHSQECRVWACNHLSSSASQMAEINRCAAAVLDDDTDLSKATYSDPSVGFVVKTSQNDFRIIEKIIENVWDKDDRDLYERVTY
ncbi:hypothetical protein D6D01_03266 [Aureobasidium pullulans]|uniref:Uncharacterized protein n=1 Tax=Aureobasidium pullulans TaxID=5580 RepID=A0A4S9LLT8_AURPU|nr:hypothetical protein D6D01_03266 [Aureobasidium pullulans]